MPLHRFRAPDGTTFRAPLQDPRIPAALSGVNGTPITGSGQTLGLMELDDYLDSDITTYEQQAASAPLPAVQVTRVPIAGYTPARGDGAEEVTLDIDMVIALAPGTTAAPSTILVYEAPNTDVGILDNYLQIATQNRASTVSTSWGMCEQASPAVPLVATYEFYIFLAMALQQQSLFAAAGDKGAYDCETTAQTSGPLTVDDPASDPLVAAVGGTHLNLDSSGSGYASETAWGGPSCFNYGTDAAPDWGPCGGGGGLSVFWPEPSWMTGTTNPYYSNGYRQVPDVALDADPNNGSGYGIYYTDPSSGASAWEPIGGGADLYAFAPSGSLKWQYRTEGAVMSSPAIGPDGTIYVGSSDGDLNALYFDGSLKWRYQTGFIGYSSPTIGDDGTIYVQGVGLYALTPTGALKWRYFEVGSVASSPAIGTDGTIYVGNQGTFFDALTPSGTIKWVFRTGGVQSSPAIGGDGVIYFGSADDFLYAVNADGSLKWKYQTGGDIVSSPALGADGTIYVGSPDHYLYAIGPGRAPASRLQASPAVPGKQPRRQ